MSSLDQATIPAVSPTEAASTTVAPSQEAKHAEKKTLSAEEQERRRHEMDSYPIIELKHFLDNVPHYTAFGVFNSFVVFRIWRKLRRIARRLLVFYITTASLLSEILYVLLHPFAHLPFVACQ